MTHKGAVMVYYIMCNCTKRTNIAAKLEVRKSRSGNRTEFQVQGSATPGILMRTSSNFPSSAVEKKQNVFSSSQCSIPTGGLQRLCNNNDFFIYTLKKMLPFLDNADNFSQSKQEKETSKTVKQ